MTYGTQIGVEAMVGDVVASRTFVDGGTPSIPSLTELTAYLDQRGSELDVHLAMAGYTTPVVQADDADSYALLERANNAGAAADVLMSLPIGSYTDPMGRVRPTGRASFYQKVFEDALKLIGKRGLNATHGGQNFYSGGMEDRSTGETKASLFTRGKFDVPGSRVLKE